MSTARCVATLALVFLGLPPAALAWEVRPDAPAAEFEEFHRHFAAAVYPYGRHGAAPLGWVGFEIFADLAATPSFENEGFAGAVIDGSLPADALAVARVGARKGLPWGLDIGASYGKVLDGDLELISADVEWAFLEGGAVKPALGLRLTASASTGGGTYDLNQYGAELRLSKGFPLLSLYAGAGVARSQGRLERPTGDRLKVETTEEVLYGGVVINLLIPKLVVGVEKGEEIQWVVRASFGF